MIDCQEFSLNHKCEKNSKKIPVLNGLMIHNSGEMREPKD